MTYSDKFIRYYDKLICPFDIFYSSDTTVRERETVHNYFIHTR